MLTNYMAGIKVESTLKAGGLVSDALMMRLISNELYKRGWLASQGRSNIMTLSSSVTSMGVEEFNSTPAMDPFLTASPLSNTSIPLQTLEDPSASLILDGYPRTAPQAGILDGLVPINLAVSIKTPVDVILQRFAGRWVHPRSGRIYNMDFNAPRVPFVDDITGEPLVQRSDDRPEVVRARLKKFQETSEPLLEHYAKKGVLWEVMGMSSDEISPKLFREFETRFT